MLILFGLGLLMLLLTFWPYSGEAEALRGKQLAPEAPGPLLNDAPPVGTDPQNGPGATGSGWPLRYVAVCPACGCRVGRREFWRFQDPLAVTCAQCHSRLRSIRMLDYSWALLLALPSGGLLALALVGAIGWLPGLIALALHFAAGHILFPYITKLELVAPPPEQH